jgi:hypothetical protein
MTAMAKAPDRILTIRKIEGLGVLDFEERPTYRAYHWTPEGPCMGCDGSGRMPSAKRPAPATIQCDECKGTGEPKRQRLPSVSTIRDAITPKDLSRWGEERGIHGAWFALSQGEVSAETEPERVVEIVRTLGLGAEAARDNAAARGINAHAMLERYMRTGEAPVLGEHLPEHRGFVQSLCRFLLEYDPQPLADGEGIEELVCDPIRGYAGRRDLRCMVGGKRVSLDVKTQARGNIYSGAHLQLAMYEQAGWFCGDEPSDELWLLALPADGALPEPMRVDTDQAGVTALVDASLTFWKALAAIDSACQKRNRELRA